MTNISVEDLAEPLTYPAEAFISPEYAKAEADLLWPKVWQMAGRIEEIPNVGDYITYNILDESILIVRAAPDRIKAFYNVCPHRGRQLVNTPDTENRVCGHRQRFVCGFHGWTFNLEGENVYILDPQDWKGGLTPERTRLSELKADIWGGWVFINMDPDSVSLREFLEPAAGILDPFEFEKMRYKWRQWVVYPSNWKTALEAFMEPYHVTGTHPQLLKYGEYYAYSKAYGLHGVSGFDERDPALRKAGGTSNTRAGKGLDPRVSTY
jgi:phenylpropionate dioxygenase-like ring-hydroxylating dioxygenase large terminal subunit